MTCLVATTPPSDAAPAPRADAPPRRWWQRRLVDPIRAQLTQGVTPDKLAATFAVGTGASMFPFLGTTSTLNLLVGLALRMNQPILQTLNQLLGPLHLVMVLVYVRVGEKIWGSEPLPLSIPVLIREFRELSLGEFFAQFGWAGIHATTAWALSLPLLVPALYYGLRPVFRRLAARGLRRRPGSAPATTGHAAPSDDPEASALDDSDDDSAENPARVS